MESPRSRSKLAVARLGLLVLTVLGSIVLLAFIGTDGVRDLLTDISESRWGIAAFILAYAVSVILLLPGTIGTLTAGAVFGFPLGGFAALAGATIGAAGGFIVSRYLGREGAQQLFGARLSGIDEWIGRNDFLSILVLRLMPVVPFNLLNYGSGLTSVRLGRYVLASLIGMAPATFLAVALADSADDPFGGKFIILLVLFVLMLVGSGFVARRMQSRRAMAADSSVADAADAVVAGARV